MRKIIHIDMDAFYASVEQRDNPSLKGKPLVVGGDPNGRGVVAAASYEIRQFGVHSAMSCYKARKLCPQAIFVRPRFEVYRQISQQIRGLMRQYTELVEPLSLDEAYLDVSDSPFEHGSATLIANRLRAEILAHTGLTASAGVSYNKMLAKIASDLNKPNGIAVITPEQAMDFIAQLPVKKFHGIGKATVSVLHDMQIFNGLDLRQTPVELLEKRFGKRGIFYHEIAHGIDNRAVKAERKHKSVGSETTFYQDSRDKDFIIRELFEQNRQAFADLQKKNRVARTVTIKLKYSDFSSITRSHTVAEFFGQENDAHQWLIWLYDHAPHHLPVRLVGVTYSNLQESNELQNTTQQLNLFDE